MTKIKPIPKKAKSLIHFPPQLEVPLKILGNGKLATGITHVLVTFEKEILRAAEEAKKAS